MFLSVSRVFNLLNEVSFTLCDSKNSLVSLTNCVSPSASLTAGD